MLPSVNFLIQTFNDTFTFTISFPRFFFLYIYIPLSMLNFHSRSINSHYMIFWFEFYSIRLVALYLFDVCYCVVLCDILYIKQNLIHIFFGSEVWCSFFLLEIEIIFRLKSFIYINEATVFLTLKLLCSTL